MFDVEPHSPNSDIKQLCSIKCGVVLLAKKGDDTLTAIRGGVSSSRLCYDSFYMNLILV